MTPKPLDSKPALLRFRNRIAEGRRLIAPSPVSFLAALGIFAAIFIAYALALTIGTK